ncbi:AAA family ATPase [Ruegeria sp. HKCCSP335]|uniref:ParA family protein n=1 Tax=Ruegeria sp. HKCCSP335 TaxID=2794833 RepID=UPI001AE14C1A|nr:AAA family ATPase [Ruegeria sp. HKCCSP335]
MTGVSTFQQFFEDLSDVMLRVNTKLQRDVTLRSRVSKRFTRKEVCEFLAIDQASLWRAAEQEPLFPEGERSGRERTFSPHEVMLIRALMASRPSSKKQFMWWREPGDPLKVIAVGSQKGGTSKSLTAAHLAQYLCLEYGLRVGVIDSDPQATISLYFADDQLNLMDPDILGMADFMGAADPKAQEPTDLTPEEMDAIWQDTPWPGTRLIPGGPAIQNADMALFFMSQARQNEGQSFPAYRVLYDAIQKWDHGMGPRTRPMDLRDTDGNFDMEAYQNALTETVDVIIIDQQPSLTFTQMNGLIAADCVIVAQTMKGFDLSTLTGYVTNIRDYTSVVTQHDPSFPLGNADHCVLATIVQESNEQDIQHLIDLKVQAPEWVAPVYYMRSDAIPNMAEQYKSAYEYQPPKSRKKSAQSFIENANAVNDYLVSRALPELPSRGYAQQFLDTMRERQIERQQKKEAAQQAKEMEQENG